MKNLPFFHAHFRAFSLVEMLMALLVASLLMAALAPVMTKKLTEGFKISVEGTLPGTKVHTHNITYEECINSGGAEKTVKDSNGKVLSKYCEGEFTVPVGFNGNMTVTAIGAGGGGGAAATAGYTEYTTPGSTETFIVPLMINQLEATLISGGAGGGAGGIYEVHVDYTKSNDENWKVPDIAKGKEVLITACGGGGGGGGGLSLWCGGPCEPAGGGGSGGYVKNRPFSVPSTVSSIPIRIGGQGGRGAHGHQEVFSGGFTECGMGSGAGGGDKITALSQVTSCSNLGGNGGSSLDSPADMRFGATGGYVDSKTRAGSGEYHYSTTQSVYMVQGGAGNNGGNGGASQHNITEATMQASPGAGGGYYGGGGGGGTCSGGGGGGGGPTFFNNVLYASGGGGGGSIAAGSLDRMRITGAGGGGGGGTGGGNGGNGGIPSPYQGAGSPGMAGAGGVDGKGYLGGVITDSPFPATNCHGGDGAPKGEQIGSAGGTGALRITYLDYGPGGSGGGGGGIVPIQPVQTKPGEKFTISIGEGGVGGKKGYIEKVNSTTGKIVQPTRGTQVTGDKSGNFSSKILNSDNQTVLSTLSEGWTPTSGSPTGQIYSWWESPYYGHVGGVITGKNTTHVTIEGFASEGGKSGGNTSERGNITIKNGTVGGDGGRPMIFGKYTCENPAKGGTAANPTGGNASGYGCGGGGGYGLSDGGAGSGGYARISWNKYWDTEKGEYKLNNIGAGGGGASGNVMKYTINVKSGEKIKYRIGKGGEGAYIVASSGAEVTEALNGGDTIFAYGTTKAVKAGGGGAGSTPKVSDDNTVIINGAGGEKSDLCDYYNKPYISSSNANICTKGDSGKHAAEAKGGNGSSLTSYGTGGEARAAGRGNTDGNNASGYGAGGAGASLRDVDKVPPAEVIANPTKGGNGSDGAIILKWEE